MTAALIAQPIDEVLVLSVPAVWDMLPEEWREGVAYWFLVRGALASGGFMVGPPTDIEWSFLRTVEDCDAVVLRHECEDCTAAVTLARKLLAEGAEHQVALAQCVITYLMDPRDIRQEFVPKKAEPE